MSPKRQSVIGVSLAGLILAAWAGLHVYGVFFREAEFSWETILLIVLQTWLSVGMYIVAHDAMHGSLWPTRRKAGNLIGAVAVWLYAGFDFRKLVYKHHAHHRHAGSRSDPDFSAETPTRAGSWYAGFMRTYVGKAEIAGMVLRVGVYLLLGASIGNIVLFFALPGLLSSFQLFYFGTFLPHRHREDGGDQDFRDHHRTRSNDFGYMASLLSCFHFGYHYEHHARPSVPWWHLPKVRGT